MPKKPGTGTKYRVANPNAIPPGVAIIQWLPPGATEELSWFEGDEFVPHMAMNLARLLDKGFIIPSREQ